MCDTCKVKQRAIDVQRTVIDRQEAQIGKQNEEILQLRTTIAGIYEWMQTMIDNAEAELKRRDDILCLMEPGEA